MGKAVRWYRRDGELACFLHDTVDEAVEVAVIAFEAGDETLVCIEHEGQSIGFSHPMVRSVLDRNLRTGRYSQSRPPSHHVEVRSSDGTWSLAGSRRSASAAQSLCDDYARVLGTERVRVKLSSS